ncbi:ATP-binding protein [Rhodoplanes sp. TEM]|uniref:histidine kinase n=1 Tax=Rhodoplanes tepidamans TaxID=200616 RepID=A0ABT5JB34_RHOTP|nr:MULTISPECIES: ATP-binding protein [Rhodoplanes]MDC7786807.1 ATP-binding protein [Rhodoplanes tepidamans]MDC7985993.1 ATP-binding protein [Rhodoplanes sp. TEM]MDQ0355934.1 signal transduction histidine kinase [Rhodoplanes tepidamans]
MMRLGFGARLVAIFVGSLVALQLLAVVAFVLQRSRATDSALRLPLPDQAAALAELLDDLPRSDWPKVLRAANSVDLSVRIVERRPDGREPDWYEAPLVDFILRRYLGRLGDRPVRVRVEPSSEVLVGPLRLLAWVSPGTIEIEIGLEGGETLVVSAGGVLALSIAGLPPGFWAGLLGLGVAGLALFLLRREARPLRELAAAVDRVPLGTAAPPIPDRATNAPEIRALIGAFNRFTGRIADLLRARMALMGGISHDLRTYVTRLRLRADLIPDAQERARTVADLDEMSRLLDDSLLASRTGAPMVNEELVAVAPLLAREVADRTPKAADGADAAPPVSLTVAPEAAAAEVLGDAIALRRLFANLVDNALRYGRVARIAATVAPRGGDMAAMLIVTVDDDGPGIPEQDRAAMLEPFARADASRNRATGGAGLGLAIANGVATQHGGTLTLADAPGGGLRATVRLPVFETVPD